MADFRQIIFEKTFKKIPGMEYNELLRVNSESEAGFFFYELVLFEESSWEQFRDKNYPIFSQYLKSKKINPEDPQGVIVAVFFKEHCHLLSGPEFVNILCQMEGLDPPSLHRRIGEWLSR